MGATGRAETAIGGWGPRDVVVVGGGIAGLTAAWRLRHRDVLLLDASDRLGGRLRSDPIDPYWLNYGAHLFPGPGTLVDGLVREMGLTTVHVSGSMMGLAVGRTRLTSGPVESYPFRLPLSFPERVAFALAGLKIRRAVAAYRRVARAGPGESPRDVRARVLAFEDERTFGEFLGPLPPNVELILGCAAHRATAELIELSAGCGIGLFALVWGGKGSLIGRNVLGGAGRLPEAIGVKLGERARTNAEVRAICVERDELVVEAAVDGELRRIRTRHVVVAAPAPTAARLLEVTAPGAATALAQLTYGAFLSVAVRTSETAPMPWDGVYAMATPGRVFDMFTNQAHALRQKGSRQPGGSLMLFAGGHAAADLSGAPDSSIAARFVEDLVGLYPEAAGRIADARVHRWPLGNVFARPGRHRHQPALEGALGPAGNVHLAGDYFAELGTMEAAARTGAAAADRIDRLLAASSEPAVRPTEISINA
jgi:oxygen-dependent protoporphyrinogen oxidase